MADRDTQAILDIIGKLRGEIAELRKLVELIADAGGVKVPGRTAPKKAAVKGPKRKKKKRPTEYF